MRHIAALSGVTTGALYGYFASKEDIFDSLVKVAYETVMDAYKRAHEEFAALPYDTQVSGMGVSSIRGGVILYPRKITETRECIRLHSSYCLSLNYIARK